MSLEFGGVFAVGDALTVGVGVGVGVSDGLGFGLGLGLGFGLGVGVGVVVGLGLEVGRGFVPLCELSEEEVDARNSSVSVTPVSVKPVAKTHELAPKTKAATGTAIRLKRV